MDSFSFLLQDRGGFAAFLLLTSGTPIGVAQTNRPPFSLVRRREYGDKDEARRDCLFRKPALQCPQSLLRCGDIMAAAGIMKRIEQMVIELVLRLEGQLRRVLAHGKDSFLL